MAKIKKNDLVYCLEEIAGGNLAVEMSGEYQGEHTKMKDSLNATVFSLNKILNGVLNTAGQVSIAK